MYTDYENGADLADYDSENDNLDTTLYTYDNPTTDGRYSRYIVADDIPGAVQVDANAIPSDANKENMWKKINKTGSANCCGGGFIRKFSDGTNDWTRPNRLSIDPSNFQCLNYTNTMYKESPTSDVEGQWFLDANKFCFTPTEDTNLGGVQKYGCVQTSFIETTDFNKVSFTGPDYDHTGTPAITFEQVNLEYAPENTETGNGNLDLNTVLGKGALYYATAYTDGGSDVDGDGTIDGYNQTYLNDIYRFRDHSNFVNESTPAVTSPGVSGIYGYQNSMKLGFILPIYANISSGIGIKVHFRGNSISNAEYTKATVNSTSEAACKAIVNATETYVDGVGVAPATNATTSDHDLDSGNDVFISSCYYEDTVRKRYILLVSVSSDDSDNDEDVTDWDYAWPEIIFDTYDTNPSLSPGESMHYLDKLGEYELLGIPQITYEPLFCNDVVKATDFPADRGARLDEEKLVPGIYDSSIESHQEYLNEVSYNSSSPEGHFQEDKFAVEQIFSAHEFRCCSKLGSKVTRDSKCCSNYANNDIDGNKRCALPSGTNLNVYFNKFVSSEGDVQELDNGVLDEELALIDTEFDANGSPKQDSSVRAKLQDIGAKFCQNRSNPTRSGVAFDYYIPQPNNSNNFVETSDFTSFYSILDSSDDIATQGVGNYSGNNYFLFTQEGYKWNHHIYCN